MLRRVARVRTDVSEELSASSIIRLTGIVEICHYVFLRSVHRLLATANVSPTSPILVTLIMEELSSSETSVFTAPSGVISQKTPFFIITAVKNLQSYIELTGWTLQLRRNVSPVK
jgi:hypothetical protein